jgi:hypothetical protein
VASVAEDDENIRLADVIGEHNFLNDATFELRLITELNMKNGNQPFLIVHYKGHTFTPVFIQTASNQNRQKGFSFWNAIRAAQDRKGDGQIVVPVKISRSTGKEKRTNSQGTLATPKSLFEVGLITDGNMYELELSSTQEVFGVTEEVDNPDGTKRTIVYTPLQNNKGH